MRATPLPPGALYSRAEWRALGVSSGRLAGPGFVTVFPNFSTPTSNPASINAMCRVLQQQVVPGAVISHTTAAALMQIALPWWIDGGIGALSSAAYEMDDSWVVPSTLPVAKKLSGPAPKGEAQPDPWKADLESGLPHYENGRPIGPPAQAQPLKQLPRVHCRVSTRTKHYLGPHAVAHRHRPGPSFERGGLTISHPYTVLLELATLLSHDDLVIAIDSLLAREPPFRNVTLEKLHDIPGMYSGRPGAKILRRALRDARARTDSPGETRTRLLLRRAGFPEPQINFPVTDPDTGQQRYLDLAYPELLIGVEYDGDHHRRSRTQRRADQARKDSLESAGWNLRTLTAEDIKDPQRFLDALHRTFTRAGAAAPPPSNWAGHAGAHLRRSLGPPR